ncbi:MAG: IclR family transcriptional regulator domain-containing protein [Ilumatobacteraceae bacterium]
MAARQSKGRGRGAAPTAADAPREGDFVEALARGLEVLTCFGPTAMELTVSDVAARTGLARPPARRLLLTLEHLGYVRSTDGVFSLTTRVLELGTATIAAQSVWDVARPHLVELVRRTGESSSMSQLDGSDIIYTARVPVAKIIALSVHIGTRFPAVATSMGHVLLADLDRRSLDTAVRQPSRSGVIPRIIPTSKELDRILAETRERGWAMSDERLSLGIRSIAAPVRDGEGRVRAAMNVTVHAAETSVTTLTKTYLPLLLKTASAVSAEWAHLSTLPVTEVADTATAATRPAKVATSARAR